jgi:hypothetical protein
MDTNKEILALMDSGKDITADDVNSIADEWVGKNLGELEFKEHFKIGMLTQLFANILNTIRFEKLERDRDNVRKHPTQERKW